MVEYQTFVNIMNTFAEQADTYAEIDSELMGGGHLKEYFQHAIWPVMHTLIKEMVSSDILDYYEVDEWDTYSSIEGIREFFWDYYCTTAQVEIETEDNRRIFKSFREVYTPLVAFEWLMNIRKDPNTWHIPTKKLSSGYTVKKYYAEFDF